MWTSLGAVLHTTPENSILPWQRSDTHTVSFNPEMGKSSQTVKPVSEWEGTTQLYGKDVEARRVISWDQFILPQLPKDNGNVLID